MSRKPVQVRKYLDYDIIAKATEGEYKPIEATPQYYSGYIAKLSMRYFYDDYGMLHCFVDEELREGLKSKLITRILAFQIH